MKLSIAIVFIIPYFVCSKSQHNWDEFDVFNFINDPDSKRNVTDLIKSKGYPAEEHTVLTADGYLLGVQRIPSGHKKRCIPKKEKKVVLLQHGLLSCSTDFVINFPDQSLGFILADAGYDVWLGNIRGNTYSRHHVKYSPNSKEFWKFSFDEMAAYDLPAMINYILNHTGEKQLYYVGHSQGTTMQFALLSQSLEFNKKVKLFVALAPVVELNYMGGALRYLAPFINDFDFVLELLGVNEFLPSSALIKFLSELLCETKARFICEDAIFLICGTDVSQLNQTRLGVYVSHSPSGASTQSIVHFAQIHNAKKFQKYDFGKKGNLEHYNQTKPPVYNVQNITTNVALFWSDNDKLADPNDVHNLEKQLKSLVSSMRVKLHEFNHLDYVWAIDAHQLLYDNVLSLLEKY